MEKTIVFLVFIFVGILLKVKFSSPQELGGIKKIILNLSLPATIFIALLGVEIEPSLLLLPVLALLLNFLLFGASAFVLPWIGVKKNTPAYLTARLLIPSLAPGLSCFPFVLEFLGESYLAKAAMADLGNKVFVLIVLYVIAMKWFQAGQRESKTGLNKILDLAKSLLNEPVNIFIAVALLLLAFGINLESLPFFISESLSKMSMMMTPLVLLFIGLAVKIKKKQFFQIFSLLTMRAGLVFLFSAIFVMITGLAIRNDILLIISFGLSATSFWPYAHISLVADLEKEKKHKTFDSDYAINILAMSFPLSTMMILGVLNSGDVLVQPTNIIITGIVLVCLGFFFPLVNGLGKKMEWIKMPKPELKTSDGD